MHEGPTATDLMRSRAFLPFFVTQLLTAFNDNFFKNAMIIWISATAATAFGLDPAKVIFLCHAVFILPFFVLSATAGQLADKNDKAAVIRFVKLAEVAIMAIAAVGFVSGSLPILLAALFGMGVHSAFLGPVKYGIVPELVPAEGIVVGNAIVEMGTFLAILGGTILGGVLVNRGIGLDSTTGAGTTMTAVAIVALAVIGLAASRAIPGLSPASPGLVVQWDLVRPTLDILRITSRTRSIFLAVLGISWFWFVGACFLSLFPVYAKETLGATESVVTVLLATFCVGIAVGSMLTERISGPNLELALVPIGALGMSVAMLDVYFVGAHPAPTAGLRDVAAFLAEPWARRLLVDLAAIAVCAGFYTVPLYAFIAKRAPKDERARIVAGNNVLNSLFMVMATGFLIAMSSLSLPVPTIVLVIAGLNLLAAIYIESVVPEFVLRFVAWVLSRVMYRLEVTGAANVPQEGPCVVVANHVSFVDWLVIGGSIARPMRFVMDHRIAETPVVSTLVFRRGKAIPIAPAKEDPAVMERAFARIAAELRDGEVVCIFPEGKLTSTGEMNAFKSGIERIIAETPVPVVPMALDGLWGSIFSRKDGPALSKPPRRFRARIRLTIGEPIRPEEVTAQRLEERVRALLG